MKRRLVHSHAVCAVIAACSHDPTAPPVQPQPWQPPIHSHIAQVAFGREAHFALCQELACPARTPKTVAGAGIVRPVALSSDQPVAPLVAVNIEKKLPRIEIVILAFPSGTSSLTPRARDDLAAAKDLLTRGGQIVIKGRTDDTGQERGNDRIALARAVATRNFIVQRFPDVVKTIVIQAKGSCCYVADNGTRDGRARNRRVEVHVTVPG